jgi:hypothetical protein
LLKIQVFWDITLYQVSISHHFKESQCLDLQWLLDHEDEGNTVLQNAENYVPNNKVSYLRRHDELKAKQWQLAYGLLRLLFLKQREQWISQFLMQSI